MLNHDAYVVRTIEFCAVVHLFVGIARYIPEAPFGGAVLYVSGEHMTQVFYILLLLLLTLVPYAYAIKEKKTGVYVYFLEPLI